MSTRAQQAELIRDSGFLDQLAGCLIYAATQIINEDPSTTSHSARLAFANAIFANPTTHAAFMAPGMLTNATISGEAGTPSSISDSDMDYVVASLYNVYAVQYTSQTNIGAFLGLGS